MPTFNNTRFII